MSLNAHITIDFKCKNCGAVVARRVDNFLYFAGSMMSLFSSGFAFPCECGTTFYFDFRKAGVLPRKGEITERNDDRMLRAA